MKILLQEPITVTNGENSKVFSDELVIMRMVDRPNDKMIRVFFKECQFPIDLWKDDEYDAIGQWTDDDVINKIKTLYNIQ